MEKKLSLPIVQIRRAGDTLYLSGQVGFETWGQLIDGGIEEQTRQTMLNMRDALATEGATLRDLIKINAWVTRAADFGAFNLVYASFFDPDALPARTTVVSDLAIPGSLIEIDGIAVIGQANDRDRA